MNCYHEKNNNEDLMRFCFIMFLMFLVSCGNRKDGQLEQIQNINIDKKNINIQNTSEYSQMGVGGGGAMTSLSFSPYSNLWLVGTDMGTLFRSSNQGQTWHPIDKKYFTLTSNLSLSSKVGFFSDGRSLIFSSDSKRIFLSKDSGESWLELNSLILGEGENVKYFRSISNEESSILLATNKGLYLTENFGNSWKLLLGSYGDPQGTFVDYHEVATHLYHSDTENIFVSKDKGRTWSVLLNRSDIKAFTGGRSSSGLTLAFSDRNGLEACSDVLKFKISEGESAVKAHQANCGFLWVAKNGNDFMRTNQAVGDHIVMAENDNMTIYTSGSTKWIRQYGTKVWRSINAGDSFELVLHQYNWDTGNFTAWNEKKLERSAIALDVGWDDNGYVSFETNLRNSNEVGGTGFYFLFTSLDKGAHWKAPFTKFADKGNPTAKKAWTSNGLEVTSVYKIKQHPLDSKIVYSAMADISGMVSVDNGVSWRITKAITDKKNNYNSIYDFAFTKNTNEVFAVTSTHHDFPNDGWITPNTGSGAVLFSNDKGKNWTELTSNTFSIQYLSIVYDDERNILFAGSQGKGIVTSEDKGKTWKFLNDGLPLGDKIIPQLELDPSNGDLYALLTGNHYGKGNDFSNNKYTGIYRLKNGSNKWVLLRGKINRPSEISSNEKFDPWLFPTAFAVDFYSENKTLYLADVEKEGRWLHSGVWKSSDDGRTWNRVTQYTHPRAITINKNNPDEIHVSGLYYVDGNWGEGGLLFSKDGGETWERNDKIPHKTNATFTHIDVSNPNNIFYGFHGNAIMYGPKP